MQALAFAACSDVQAEALLAVIQERERQDAKWGVQDHNLYKWNAILVEEVGEFAEATLGASRTDLRREATHVAATALAIVEFIDRSGKP